MSMVKKLLTIAALTGSGTAYAGVPAWTVSEASGPVQVARPGLRAVSATRGGLLRAGDMVSTGKSGRAVLVRGEEYLVVSPGSRITIAEPKAGGMTQIIQNLGNTLFKIKKMATPHFAVETPYLAAVVKGTTFSVTVTASGAAVQVTEGRVQVVTLDGGASYLVTPGEIGVVNRSMPYRLTVQGRETTVIDSPNKSGGTSSPKVAEPVVAIDTALEGGIKSAVSEGPVDLKNLSGGLISGSSSTEPTTKFAELLDTKGSRPVFGIVENIDTGGGGDTKPGAGDTTGRGTGTTDVGAGGVMVGGNMGTGVTLGTDPAGGTTVGASGGATGIVGAGAGISLGGSGGASGSGSGAGASVGVGVSGSGTGVGAGAGVSVGGAGAGAGVGVGASVGAGAGGSGSGVGAGAGVSIGVNVGAGGSGVGVGVGVGNGNGNGNGNSGNGNGNNGNGNGNGGGNGSNGGGHGNGNGGGIGIGVTVGGGGIGVGINLGGGGLGIGLGGNGNGNGNGRGRGGGS